MGSIGVAPVLPRKCEEHEPKPLHAKIKASPYASGAVESLLTQGCINHASSLEDAPAAKEPTMVPIAIVGMAARLPGNIRSTDELWDALLSQKDLSCEVPKERYNIDAFYSDSHIRTVKTRRGFFLSDDLADADPSMFEMASLDTARMDPQQRLLMEVVWECMENAGQVDWQGKDIGCYIGTFGDDWLEMALRDPLSLTRMHIFNANDFALSNRVSYQYDLRGPSMTLKTGCSASMVGLHEACQSVASRECSSAIVAGTSLIMTPTMTACMSENMVLAPDGLCKTFDAEANGFGRGEAVNAVYIKRLDQALEDGDPIRAVIRSTTTNSDGRTRKMAIPSADAQEALIRKAYERAGISDLSRTGLFECHGTGTAAGDKAETEAIAKVFGNKGIHIGAVKPNVGHSEGASGLTSIIKAVLSLEHKAIAPNFRFKTPNPKIPFKEANLIVPQELTPWPSNRYQRISVNSFGIGGANAHVIMESAEAHRPAAALNGTVANLHNAPKLLVVSAKSANSLDGRIEALRGYCKDRKTVTQDLAHTLGTRREHWRHRAFTVVQGAEVPSELSGFQSGQIPPKAPESLVFVFTGQGSQWHGMGKELLAECLSFRTDIERMDQTLQTLSTPPNWSMKDKLLAVSQDPSSCLEAEFAQPLCTAIQIGLVNLLASWGIRPTAVIGHSSGEGAAAYASGAIDAEIAIITAYYRGQAAKARSKPGGMVAIGMSRASVTKYLQDGVGIACENGPRSVVISGDSDSLTQVLDRITQEEPETYTSRLDVETAYHSRHMAEVGNIFQNMVETLPAASATKIPMYSTVYGRVLRETEKIDGQYWRDNLEGTVLFSTAVEAALAAIGSKSSCFIEIGPHCPLAGPLRQIFRHKMIKPAPLYVSTLHKNQNQAVNMFQAAGQLFLSGIAVSMAAVNGSGEVLTDLPPYPWDYSVKRFAESRVSKGWRQRMHPHHELLGSRVMEINEQEPCWRNIIRFENSAWLADHKLSGCIVFPAAGYIGMIGEAIRQVTGSTGYLIENMFLRNAMLLDQEKDIEIMTSLRLARLTDVLDSDWYEFTIYSHDGTGWTKHCSGRAAATPEGKALSKRHIESFGRPVEPAPWYRVLKRAGLDFGPHFQGLQQITADPIGHRAAARLTSRHDLGKNDAYAVHPTLIDKSLQLFSVAAARGLARYVDRIAVPISIERIEIRQCDERALSAHTSYRRSLDGNFSGDTQAVNMNHEIILDIKGLRCFAMDSDAIANASSNATWSATAEWHDHIDFCSMENFLAQPPARMWNSLCLLEQATVLVILKIYRLTKDVTPSVDHIAKYKAWIQTRVSQFEENHYSIVPQAQEWARMDPMQQESILSTMSQSIHDSDPETAFFAGMIDRMSSNCLPVFNGEVSSIELLMEDNSLEQFYDYTIYPDDMRPFLSTLGHSNSGLRVLEIGAGTGGMTRAVLECLQTSGGVRMYSEYVYTDISPGFFTGARERFAEYCGISYRVLDISKSPLEQGFESASFDLVVCSNVLHATPSLRQTLENVHMLLSPGGYLLLQEIAADTFFLDALMGSLPGWWVGENDGRSEKPHVTPERWDAELRAAGFTGVESQALDNQRPYQFSANMISRRPHVPGSEKVVDLLYNGRITNSARLIEQAYLADGFAVNWFTLEDATSPRGHVISLLDIDTPFFHDISEEDFLAFRRFLVDAAPKTIVWVSRQLQRECADPRWSHVLGIARTARLEISLPFFTVEMDVFESGSIASLVGISGKVLRSDLSRTDLEYEYSISGESVQTCRYHPTRTLAPSELNGMPGGPKSLEIGTHGLLDSLQWVQAKDSSLPGPGELEVATRYVGMNFRDMMIAMGFINHGAFGFEGTGIIRQVGPGSHHQDFKVGDRVCFIGGAAMSTSIVVKSSTCLQLPEDVPLDDAATIPAVYSTAVYCLVTVGQLEEGQSVLIHSACGGVGLAAIQLCQMLGAEIYATVGSDEKAQHLVSNHGISRGRIFNSRSPAFKQDVLRVTEGRGVDIVLNSLSGECLHASWECVAHYGKMIEIGKRDMMGRGKLDLDKFGENRMFVGVDLHQLGIHKPDALKKAVEQSFRLIAEGKLKPIEPKTVFEAENIIGAFRHMQTGDHIGKIVIRMPEDPECLPAARFDQSLSLSPEASYLLVGGVGGLGMSISRWMIERGARNLIYLSRSAGTTPESKNFFRELEVMGCTVHAVSGSVRNSGDVQRAVALCGEKPLGGVVQMAMVLKDQMLANMSFDDWVTCIGPKVDGTWNLYNATKNLNIDFFVVFGSIVGLCANVGQSNYGAANSWVEAFARYARRQGSPVCGINLGGVEDVGYVSNSPEMLKRCRDIDFNSMGEGDMLRAVEAAIRHAQSPGLPENESDQASVTIGLQPATSKMGRATYQNDPRFSTFQIKDMESTGEKSSHMDVINQVISDAAQDVTTLDKASTIDTIVQEIGRLVKSDWDENDSITSIAETAVDSLMTIEIRSWLRKRVNVDVPTVKITKAGNIGGLGRLVVEELRAKYGPKDGQ